MTRRMDWRAITYWLTIVSVSLSVIYGLIETYDAWSDDERRKLTAKAFGTTLGFAFLIFLLFNPPE